MSRAGIRDYLSSIGYQVSYREQEWAECLISGDGRAWIGRGLDRDAAFGAALAELAPNPLATRLIAEAAARWAAESELMRPSLQPDRVTIPADSIITRTETPRDVRRAEAIEPPSPGQIAVILSRPTTPRPSMPTPAIMNGGALPAEESVTPDPRQTSDPERSLEALDILLDRIRDSREELGLCAPDRQRLAMLAWICEARSHADAFPDEIRIRDRVGAISRLLTEIGKTFWPGSVTALQLHMQPRDLPRHLLGGVATTWHRAAELAEQQLRIKELEDERRGYDAYGWGDGRQLIPRPANPRAVFQSVVAEMEKLSGPLGTHAPPGDSEARPEPSTFLRWVRLLRWLRGSTVEPDTWARVAGRLRWWAFRREPALGVAARELEPSFAPTQSWAAQLGQDPEQRQKLQKLRDLLASAPTFPEGEAGQAALIEWLMHALPFGDSYHGNIVRLMEGHREQVLALSVEQLPDGDRRLRRRLIRLQEDLQKSNGAIKPAPLPEPEGGESLAEGGGDDEIQTLPGDMLRRVRTTTEGKRSVFVSHRRDPDLQAKLQETFGFATLDCKIVEPRRLQALGEAIEEGLYDVVIAATGFQLGSLDQLLARACRSAGVTYLRVNRGWPLALLRALARDLDARPAP